MIIHNRREWLVYWTIKNAFFVHLYLFFILVEVVVARDEELQARTFSFCRGSWDKSEIWSQIDQLFALKLPSGFTHKGVERFRSGENLKRIMQVCGCQFTANCIIIYCQNASQLILCLTLLRKLLLKGGATKSMGHMVEGRNLSALMLMFFGMPKEVIIPTSQLLRHVILNLLEEIKGYLESPRNLQSPACCY